MPIGSALPEIDVVAAVLKDRRGRVLIAERPAGKPLAGFWEFPGGKVEAGEAAAEALCRELEEELGIEVRGAYRLLRFAHDYPERRVNLDVWRVTAYGGEPSPREGQNLAWAPLDDFSRWPLLPADAPIAKALSLPLLMLVTPPPEDDAAFLEGLQRSLEAGIDWVRFRAPGLDSAHYARLAERVADACRSAGTRFSLSGDMQLARQLKADGLHLAQAALDGFKAGARNPLQRLGISCHSAEELRRALDHGPDYLTLGPVKATATHPGFEPLGWERFAALASTSPVPVYAIGGLGVRDLMTARSHGAHGVAAIRDLWDRAQLSELS